MSNYTPEQQEIVRKVLNQNDYYQVLGLSKQSSIEDIQRAYKKLSLKIHPDKNRHPKASEAFQKLNKIMMILKDDTKRKIQDQTGDGERAENNGMNQHTHEAQQTDPSDIFEEFFGGGFGGGFFGPNVRFQSNGGGGFRSGFGGGSPFGRQKRRSNATQEQPEDQSSPQAKFSQNLNLMLQVMCFLWMFFSLAGGAFGSTDLSHLYKFEYTHSFQLPKKTNTLKVPFYASETLDSYVKNQQSNDYSRIQKQIEKDQLSQVKNECQREQQQVQNLKNDQNNIFSYKQRSEDLKTKITNQKKRNCDEWDEWIKKFRPQIQSLFS